MNNYVFTGKGQDVISQCEISYIDWIHYRYFVNASTTLEKAFTRMMLTQKLIKQIYSQDRICDKFIPDSAK
ncbi:hypothetical protein NIES3974_12220 [Calothrix sp. NIES-3974]|nr:hypothetical protein NIES3974_12220 [Calothrix sp. NIES-3974]